LKSKVPYYPYSTYQKEKYGKKVYKIPINLPVTCPNRDGTLGVDGCDFCAEEGAGFEALSSEKPVKEQLEENINYIGKRYGVDIFSAYFQNYTNTYMPMKDFKQYMEGVLDDRIVELAISTRPDCVSDEQLDYLKEYKQIHDKNIVMELGLQTANYHTLFRINRGHGLAAFIDATNRIKQRGLEVCAHVIINLPGDEDLDMIETADILSALKVEQVKLHALYIMKNTIMGNQYEQGELSIISRDDYQRRVILFLMHLNPEIAVQRLIGRAPKENSLFVNWKTSWWKIRDEIIAIMKQENAYQGKQAKF